MDGTEAYFVGKANTFDPSMDSSEQAVLRKLEEWLRQAKQAQGPSRAEMAEDRRFKDGNQWTPEEKYELEVVRGQPALVYNEVAPTLRWVTGTEKRARIDYKIRARHGDQRKDAENKTKLLKFVMDLSNGPYQVSRAFDNQSCEGLGWLEAGVRQDPSDDPLYVRYENWRNVWYDHLAVEPDLSDARFLFRDKWVDLDVAIAMFPQKKVQLTRSAERLGVDAMTDEDELSFNQELYPSVGYRGNVNADSNLDIHGHRQRVKLVECWWRKPEASKVLHGKGGWNGSVQRKGDQVQQWAIDSGEATTFDAVKFVTYHALFVEGSLLVNERTEVWNQTFPLFPLWGWRRGDDNAPYGLVRNMKDPQRDLNKRQSKALHVLSTRQVVMDKGAVDDIDELAEEVANPDGIIEVNTGKRLDIKTDYNLAAAHVNMAGRNSEYIQRSGGITDENLGRETNASSGKAINARQQQGVTSTTDLFDNRRFGFECLGRYILSLVEQYYDQAKTVSITGERGEDAWLDINQPDPETGEVCDPTASQGDFIIDSENHSATVRQAMFESLMEVIRDLPGEIAIKFMDLAFDLSDMPLREEFVSRLREINGQRDPNKEQSEEEKQAEQQQAKQEQELAMRERMAVLSKLEGEAKKVEADARKAMSEGDFKQVAAAFEKMKAMGMALELSPAVAGNQELTSVADDLMSDAATGVEKPEAAGAGLQQ